MRVNLFLLVTVLLGRGAVGQTDDVFRDEVLKWHNEARALHGAKPMTWNDEVATFARNWCQYLADEDKFEHAPSTPNPNFDSTKYKLIQEGRGKFKIGENIAMRWTTQLMEPKSDKFTAFAKESAKTGFSNWYNELKDYDFETGKAIPRDPSQPNKLPMIGHFTQVVWKGSSELGCGVSQGIGKSSSGREVSKAFLCCNYKLPGNYVGDYPNNVSPPTGCREKDQVLCPKDKYTCVAPGSACPSGEKKEEEKEEEKKDEDKKEEEKEEEKKDEEKKEEEKEEEKKEEEKEGDKKEEDKKDEEKKDDEKKDDEKKDDEKKDDEKKDDQDLKCASCAEVNFSKASFYFNGKKEKTPQVSDKDRYVPKSKDGKEKYALCSAADKPMATCAKTAGKDMGCGKVWISMSFDGTIKNEEGSQKFRWEGVEFHMEECIAREAKCSYFESMLNDSPTSEWGKLNYSVEQCKLKICDGNGENCKYHEEKKKEDDEKPDGKCHFPDLIFGGFKVKEGEHEGEKYATYMCHHRFVMTPNRDAFKGYMMEKKVTPQKAYMDLAHTAGCHEGKAYLPECEDHKKAGHCGIPNWIENGKAVEFMMKERKEDKKEEEKEEKEENKDKSEEEKNKEKEDKQVKSYEKEGEKEENKSEDKNREKEDGKEMSEEKKKFLAMMPVAARYVCQEGYKMHYTMKKDWGWCRPDGSYEVPRCEKEEDWYRLDFKLDNGNDQSVVDKDGRVSAGLVLMRPIGTNGEPKSDWEMACDDGVNDFAAGAVCRSLGFKHGSRIRPTRKMITEKVQGMKFGWTGFNCDHDDTLPQSMHCKAMRYEEALEKLGMKAKCFSFDRGAVECFDHAGFGVDVEMSVAKWRYTCRSWAEKEGFGVRLNQHFKDMKVRWLMDDKEAQVKTVYKMRRGMNVAIARKESMGSTAFKCLTCEVWAGEQKLGQHKVCKDDQKTES